MAVDPICYNHVHVHTHAVTERTSALLKRCWMCLDRSRRIRLYCTAQPFFHHRDTHGNTFEKRAFFASFSETIVFIS